MFEDIMFGYVMPLMAGIGSVVTIITLMALVGSIMEDSTTTVTTIKPTGATYLETADADMLDFPLYAENGDTHWHNGRRYIKGFRGWSLTNGAR